MLVILLMLALLTLALVQAAPSVAVQIRRDQEEEMIHRGDQYVRAVRRFYRKFGRYPTSLDELKDTNHLRFLRREYKDPVTGKEFKLLHIQDVNYQPTGFFGKSLTQPGGGGANNTFGAPPVPQPSPSPSPSPSGTPSSGDNTQPGGQGTQAQGAQGQGQQNNNGLPIFGGGPIVGVSSTSTKTSIKEINGKNHYKDWQFFYDPRMDMPVGQMFPPGTPGIGQGGTGQGGSGQGGPGQGGPGQGGGTGPH